MVQDLLTDSQNRANSFALTFYPCSRKANEARLSDVRDEIMANDLRSNSIYSTMSLLNRLLVRSCLAVACMLALNRIKGDLKGIGELAILILYFQRLSGLHLFHDRSVFLLIK